MDVTAASRDRLIWAFWAAVGLSAAGGLMPIVFAGTSSRLAGVLIPFWGAAIGFAACAILYRQGRTVTSIVYFVAGLAIVFGLLAMFSLPLRLAVLGTCPALPAPCTSGLPRPLADAENTAMGAAAAFGIVSLFVGFLGLSVMYRRPPAPFATPPGRRIPPIPAAPPRREPEPVAVEAKAPPPENSAPHEEPDPELPAHEEEELPELPAHESQ